jgi:aspartate/methionine/tyrosine aminotransferase
MASAPLDRIWDLLPDAVREVAERDTPIPSIARRAASIAARHPDFVRADIGQISQLDPELEVLYGPPVGLEELRAALAETWNLEFALSPALSAAHVAVCTGAAEALSLVLRCLGHDKTVGLPRGYWENYANAVSLAGGRAVLLDMFDAQGGFDLARLDEQLRLYAVDVLLCNFPCNPTGAVIDAAEAMALCELLRRRNLLCVADDVYARLRFDGQPPVSLLRYAPERVVAIGSASKEYLIPGARVGYVLCGNSRFTDEILRKLIRANTASPNVPGQRLLLARLLPDLADLRAGAPPRLLSRVRDELSRRRSGLVGVLGRHEFELVGRAGREPMGTIFLMSKVPPWFHGDEYAFVERAMAEAVVSVVPGASFGLPGTLRFSYGGMTETAIAALDGGLRRLRQLAAT